MRSLRPACIRPLQCSQTSPDISNATYPRLLRELIPVIPAKTPFEENLRASPAGFFFINQTNKKSKLIFRTQSPYISWTKVSICPLNHPAHCGMIGRPSFARFSQHTHYSCHLLWYMLHNIVRPLKKETRKEYGKIGYSFLGWNNFYRSWLRTAPFVRHRNPLS